MFVFLPRKPLRLSIVLGLVSWFFLAFVWTRIPDGSLVQRAIDWFYSPAFNAGYFVGTLVFPHAVPRSTGWYLVPLFGAAGQLVFLVATWYAAIRIFRVFQPAPVEEYVPYIASKRKAHRTPRRARIIWEKEPEYEAKYRGLGRLGGLLNAVHYEKFKMATWRQFREDTGRWPLATIGLHYVIRIAFVVGTLYFFSLQESASWSSGRSLLIGGLGLILFVLFETVGQGYSRRLDWKLFGIRVE